MGNRLLFIKWTSILKRSIQLDGGEIELCSLKQIIEYNEHYDHYEKCFDIAYVYQDNILFN